MMAKINQGTALALAVVFGLATAALVVNYKGKADAPANAAQARQVDYVVARETISPRATVKPEMLALRAYPENEPPAGGIRGLGNAEGRVAMRQIPAGTLVTMEMLADKGPGLGMSYNLKPYQRAVTVPIDPVSGVAGYLKPGDRVDVLATYTGSDTNTARVVLQDVELLAIGNDPVSTSEVTDKPSAPADAPTATLAVGADQMPLLALTAAKAKIHLALRSPDDHAYVVPGRITTSQVFGETTRPVPQGPAPMQPPVAAPVRTVTVETSPSAHTGPTPAAPKAAPKKTIEVTRGIETQEVPIQ